MDGTDKKRSRPTVSTVFRVFLVKNTDIRTETENLKNNNNLDKNTVGSKEYVVLLDPGTSSSIISRHCVENAKIKKSKNITRWGTPAGGIRTDEKVRIKFSLDEFSSSKQIEWKFHITKSYHKLGYDMILGR